MDNFYLNNAVYMFEARVNAIVTAEGDDGTHYRATKLQCCCVLRVPLLSRWLPSVVLENVC